MEYYAGLDVSLRSCAVCIVDNGGRVLFERELACDDCVLAAGERASDYAQELVQIARLPGGQRKVVGIAEITGLQTDVVSMHSIFESKSLSGSLNSPGSCNDQ